MSAAAHVLHGPGPDVLELLALIASLAVGVVFLIARSEGGRRDRGAHFATRAELSELRVRGPQPGRVALGVHHRALIAAEERASVLVVGPSQSGKTSGLVVPALLEWTGPALCTSIKSDVVNDTHVARAKRGEVRVFDPTGATLLPHAPWSPIQASRSWEGARRMAARLLSLGDHGPARSADEAFWRPAGARYLAPLLLAAAVGELTMREVLSWIAAESEGEPAELLRSSIGPGARSALEALRSVSGADARFRSSLTQTVATALDAWQEPQIAAATVGESEIGARWLLEGQNTLYLISPAEDQRRLSGLFCALLAEVVAGAFARSSELGGPIEPALLLCLDEVANIAPLPNLDEIASTGPGQGVQLLTVLQNQSQAADRWGPDRAQTIIANHRARLFCSGIGDEATLEHLRSTLGEQEVERVSRHRAGALQPGSKTTASERRPLAPAHRVRQLRAEGALLVYGRLAPAWLKLRPWYASPELCAIAAGGVDPAAERRRLRTLLTSVLTRLPLARRSAQ